MSTFTDQLTTDLAAFFNADEFAESVSYTPSGGSATAITVLWDQPWDLSSPEDIGMSSDTIMVLAKTSDVSAARRDETIVRGATTYKIKSVRPQDGDSLTTAVFLSRY